jgi:hypothetical protein
MPHTSHTPTMIYRSYFTVSPRPFRTPESIEIGLMVSGAAAVAESTTLIEGAEGPG